MRGSDERSGELFSYVDLEDRVPAQHPLRLIRRIVNEVLGALDSEFTKIYADSGRPSIPPERLLRALLLQAFYTIRSETQLMEQLHYNLLYRWFVGLGVADSIERNGLDVQMADLQRMIGAAVAIEAETGEPVAQRLAEAVAWFDGVFAPQRARQSAAQFVRGMQFRRRLRAIRAPKRPASS
jgi:hypothetical protein